MAAPDERALRAWLIERVGAQNWDEELWRRACEDGLVESIRRERRSDRRLQRQEELVRWYEEQLVRARLCEQRSKRIPGRIREQARSRIVAAEAERREDVRRFRERWLGGRIASMAEAAEWMILSPEQQAAAQIMRSTPPAGAWEPPSRSPSAGPTPFSGPRRELTAEQVYQEAERVARSVVIVPPEEVHRIRTGREELNALAGELSEAYGWAPEEAAIFVLTGEIPDLPRTRIVGTRQNRFVLEVDADVSPQELVAFWSKIRETRRAPAMSEKHTELAVFIASRNDGRRWREVMEEWNALHPEWAIDRLPNFVRDARAAYERVTGTELKWRRKGEE